MTKTQFLPLPGWCVLEPLEEKDYKLSESSNIGISVAEDMAQKDSAGIVLVVGDPYVLHEHEQEIVCPSPVEVGDKIIYKNVTGQKYLDFNSGLTRILVKWHPEPYWSDIICKLSYD